MDFEETPSDVHSAPPEAPAHPVPSDPATPDVPTDGTRSDEQEAESAAASPAMSEDDGKNAETIVVWRPDRSAFSRRSNGDRSRRDRDSAPKAEHPGKGPIARQDMEGGRALGRERNRSRFKEPPASSEQQEGRQAGARQPGRARARDGFRVDEKLRQTASDRDMPPSHSTSERQPRTKVDLNSPFAKLLELRALLEGQANKRH